jgi:hypothetical protein
LIAEELGDEITQMDDFEGELRKAIEERRFPPIYDTHPIVVEYADELVLPISIFIDGVPYSHVDSVIGFWAINMLTGRRHLVCCLRKGIICTCGCRGWCTFHAIFRCIAWDLEGMARKTFPNRRHDRDAWHPEDEDRQAKGGTQMKCRICLIHIKGDWAEYAGTLGFPTCGDGMRPCFGCNACGENMKNRRSQSDGIAISIERRRGLLRSMHAM